VVEIATVYWLFPETHGHTLEELSFMFEGKSVQDKVQAKVDKVMELENVCEEPTETITNQHLEAQ
jgi:hypothetical protein